MKINEQLIFADPWIVHPPHEALDLDKLEQIAHSMCSHDWQGRPIPALSYPWGYLALAGSHRIEAAKQTELPNIPLIVVDGAKFAELLMKSVIFPEDCYGIEDILLRIQLTSIGMMIMAKVADDAGLHQFAKVLKAEHEQKY